MPSKAEWIKIQKSSGSPHFKYISKRRLMDTSNWIRLKKGYDSLDASNNPTLVCWEKIGPERVAPVLTTSTMERLKPRPSSASHREKSTAKLLSELEAKRPINAWTVDEIRKTMYVPNLKKLPKSDMHFSKFLKKTFTVPSEKEVEKQKVSKEKVKTKNPFSELYAFRDVKPDPTLIWVKVLWKIAREFCVCFDSLGTSHPKVTDSFMVNLLASGCHIKEWAPIRLEQVKETIGDIEPMEFERSIDYGMNPIDDAEPTEKPLTKRERAFAYGRWYCPVKFWGKLNTEVGYILFHLINIKKTKKQEEPTGEHLTK